jgi:hypothetical protein
MRYQAALLPAFAKASAGKPAGAVPSEKPAGLPAVALARWLASRRA